MSIPFNETVLRNALPDIAAWLSAFVERQGGFLGSVHLAGLAGEGEIALVAAHSLPPAVQNGTSVIPFGKGMAGTAVQRREAVAVGDFQTDTTGVAVKAGRVAGSRGSLTLPVFDPDDDTRVLAVVGLGFDEVRGLTDDEIETFNKDSGHDSQCASGLSRQGWRRGGLITIRLVDRSFDVRQWRRPAQGMSVCRNTPEGGCQALK